MTAWAALLAGAAAGLGVAVPLGAVGVLLVRTGLSSGWRPAAAGALGVALVDLGYATAVVVLGTTVAAPVQEHRGAVRALGAAVLLAVAWLGLRAALRGPGPQPGSPADSPPASAWATFARFVALTAVNPLTAVYFAALVAGLGTAVAGDARAAFALGVFVASLAWQLGLVTAAAATRRVVPPRAHRAIGLLGSGLVAAYAVRLALGR